MITMTNSEKIQKLLNEIIDIGREEGINNILTKEEYIEYLAANILGHTYSVGRGCDAHEADGTPTEYKSAGYNKKGKLGTFQFCGMNQNKFDRLADHKNMYYIVKDGAEIVEIYKGDMESVRKNILKRRNNDLSEKKQWCASLGVAKNELNAKLIYKK